MSKFKQYLKTWEDGCGSDACETAYKICHLRGKVPADVLFIGEAPGPCEDKFGIPFKGPAGHLMESIINATVKKLGVTYRYALGNLVGCMPKENGDKKAPSAECINTCVPRLRDLIKVVNPQIIICVGSVAAKYVRRNRSQLKVGDIELVDITHPSAILQADKALQSFAVKQCVVTIADEVGRILE